jgi:hypothetical protein
VSWHSSLPSGTSTLVGDDGAFNFGRRRSLTTASYRFYVAVGTSELATSLEQGYVVDVPSRRTDVEVPLGRLECQDTRRRWSRSASYQS